MMYYCVTTTFDDHGHTTAAITRELETNERPQNTSTSTSCRDIYNDWFDDLETALDFIKEARQC